MNSEVWALLGPTNTGKTWRAIERLLAHRSGMFGVPLRLLAQEVYDKVVAAKGADQVALVTGEQKKIPANARYWICTVEAMPVDRPVAFVAVDEIQLCAHRNHGHVYTDRLLNLRGARETLFLGSDTMAPIMERLGIRVARLPRLSRLSYAGTARLESLPPRSAVVAFSVESVYALADRIRARHGGAAVVLGALSPRTRNAQVALFQSGEVRTLVATDAIGMGLNLDIHHVALGALRKFDGKQVRGLHRTELAQIAGRAGRFRRDGSFGTLPEAGEIHPDEVQALENHEFPPIKRLYWRNTELDFGSMDRLLQSLRRPAPRPWLIPDHEQEDEATLLALKDLPVPPQLLWEVCQVPDFRKTLEGSHVRLLEKLALALREGPLPSDWIGRTLDHLDKTEGDIDALTTRLAWTRTWSTIAWKSSWHLDPRPWQERTAAIEDRLSDALHQKLTQRFLEKRATVHLKGGVLAALRDEEELGRLSGLRWSGPPPRGELRGLVRQELLSRLQRLDPQDFVLAEDLRILWEGAPLAQLVGGPSLDDPRVKMLNLELLEPPEREQVRQALTRWLEMQLAPYKLDDRGLGPEARGLLWQVGRGLGDCEAPADLWISEGERRRLARLDLRWGRLSCYIPRLLEPEALRHRAALWAAFRGVAPPAPPAERHAPARGMHGEAWRAIGFRVVGSTAVRVDLLEECAFALRRRRPLPIGEPGFARALAGFAEGWTP